MSFVLLSPRRGAAVAAAEYLDVLRATGLAPEELEQRVLDSADSVPGPVDRAEGVIVGGSPFTVTRPVDGPGGWQDAGSDRLVDLVASSPVPVFLACYGASLLADRLGGGVVRTHPEQAGRTMVQLTDAAVDDPLCAGLPRRFEALTGHTENVGRLPAGAVLLATGPTCPVQVYRWGDRVWATQFHPEMDGPGMVRRMSFYPDSGYYEAEEEARVAAALSGCAAEEAGLLLSRFIHHCRAGAGQAPAGAPCR